jgi:hypothetical protein
VVIGLRGEHLAHRAFSVDQECRTAGYYEHIVADLGGEKTPSTTCPRCEIEETASAGYSHPHTKEPRAYVVGLTGLAFGVGK